MNIRTVIVAACVALSAPNLASAQTQQTEAPLSLSAIEQRLAAEGFRVVEIERYATSFEVKGYDRAGVCMEMHLDLRTGDVLRREREDDCGRRDDDRGRRGRRN